MPEQRVPLTDFRITKAANDGWIITAGTQEVGYRHETYAFTTATDMLMALPALIGHQPKFVVSVNGAVSKEEVDLMQRVTEAAEKVAQHHLDQFHSHPFQRG